MKKRYHIIFILCTMALFSGCTTRNQEINAVEEEHVYSLYFLDNNEFYTVEYYSETEDATSLTAELLNEMGLEEGSVIVTNSNVSNGVAYIYFNSAYDTMDNVYEVLFRASVVKTVSQLEDVNYVYFYVDNKPLTYDNGQIVGLMAADDFIADSDSNLDSLLWTTLTLYFADEDKRLLVENQMDVAYSRTMSLEKIVVEQLIQGPENEECYSVLPSTVKVISATVRDGICYVNFDASFAQVKTDVPFDVAMYAIINSLCELNSVNKVQFQLNGDSHVEVNGFSFESVYEMNLDYLK